MENLNNDEFIKYCQDNHCPDDVWRDRVIGEFGKDIVKYKDIENSYKAYFIEINRLLSTWSLEQINRSLRMDLKLAFLAYYPNYTLIGNRLVLSPTLSMMTQQEEESRFMDTLNSLRSRSFIDLAKPSPPRENIEFN
jgi:hypothetical protein